ncbi:MAG TPA: NAD(P)H-dependent oxidoreductase [Candidatus Pseudogracilibacillus intestinigallinarum]|uniref:NAD(P)H-dependent oxidoreductase n=1 Tax=Candidatus Pseudogracilibacillus intestinigallinarum TaxID=2838742 RepID=A0A9D1PK92_9BACI|nr:NAD(P)H-dependent oxidoreductase [Candidatus Pseudogracilibacillus intestinigallinarum]
MAKVGILIGSLRKESFSRKIALFTATLFPDDVETELIEIGHLPFYNQDFDEEDNVPSDVQSFREKVKTFDGFLIVTPEYNRSVPAVLKNAFDIGSRPKVDNVWNNKPAGIISQSPGGLGAFGANHHLRQTLTSLNMPVVQQPEMYLANVGTFLDDAGNVTNESTVQYLQGFVDTFITFMRKF